MGALDIDETPKLGNLEAEQTSNNPDCCVGEIELDEETCGFYRNTMRILSEAGIEYLVGGAFALNRFTEIARHTKDFDIFVRERDLQPTLDALGKAGYKTEVPYPHWLGKAWCDDLFVDVIFCSGNGIAAVDDAWFENAVEATVLGTPAKLSPPEEIIWSKAMVDERERYDGADVAHMLRSCCNQVDWQRLVDRFADKWRVLFSHLVLFGFIYPSERDKIPYWVMQEMLGRLQQELISLPPTERVCMGTIISREQYLIDVQQWGYRDGRLPPTGNMSQEEIDLWTEAIDQK